MCLPALLTELIAYNEKSSSKIMLDAEARSVGCTLCVQVSPRLTLHILLQSFSLPLIQEESKLSVTSKRIGTKYW